MVPDNVIDSVAETNEESCVDDFDDSIGSAEVALSEVTELNVSDAGNVDAAVGVWTTVAEVTVSITVTVPALNEPVVSVAMNAEVSCIGVLGSIFSVK